MQKNSNVFTVSSSLKKTKLSSRVTVKQAFKQIIKQAEAEGLRPITVRDYEKWYFSYTDFNSFTHIDQFNVSSIYNWINSMEVAQSTKRIRSKALKAVMGRMFNAGLLKTKFFKSVNIKVDEEIKEGATESDIQELLSHMDMTDYFQMRDACAVLMIWQTGIRIQTLSLLKESHIDLTEGLMICTGDIMKNRRRLVLPLSGQLVELFTVLMAQSQIIREEFGFDTEWLFMTKTGKNFESVSTNNVFANRLADYKRKYGIKNINAHAIRRGFAKRMLEEGVSVPVISKALGHSSLAVTTKYLNISEAELINEMKRLF